MDRSYCLLPSLPLPYYLESGISCYAPGDAHPARRSIGVYDLILVQSGRLYVGENSHQWELAAGESLLLLPDAYHYPLSPCQEPTRFYWVHFQHGGCPNHPPSLDSSEPEPDRIRLPRYSRLKTPEQAYQKLDSLVRLAAQPRSASFWSQQQLFHELLRMLDEQTMNGGLSRVRAVAEAVEGYIRSHYRQPLTYAAMAKSLHYHYNYLTRCMKEIHGITPMEYLLRHRLEQARLLLLKTDWPVARIAEESGFESVSYFCRRFAQRWQRTPLQYRRQYTS
ncbi:AraC family transcriptional regulator [Paenibacillus sp. SYP-B4298]|uniref:AraC family transcriptional regulator n=1 Tax=Paenibacillus sp. SYP-B4298 TaxID=2996034 RepID=UPI0022DD7B32|nr:AraC family transcriptional regulator [Paenibacillus sp. SYP-B4298]